MKCSKCHRESNSLTGGISGPMYCSDCYVPFEKRDDFDYVATGKTSGHVKLPNGICGICGESTVQPYPTGLWIHYQEDADEDEYQTFDHVPRQANILELLMIKSEDEHKRNGIGGLNGITMMKKQKQVHIVLKEE